MFNIKKTIGRSYNVDLDDILPTKKNLQSLGYYEEPSYGMTEYPDEDMIVGIERLQKDYGLQVDGIMQPEGEPENKINELLKPKERVDNLNENKAANQNENRAFSGIFAPKLKSIFGNATDDQMNNMQQDNKNPQNGLDKIKSDFAKQCDLQSGKVLKDKLNEAAGNVEKRNETDNKPDYSLYGKDIDRNLVDEMNRDKKFKTAIQRVRKAEGGYSNDKTDRGKETNFGISQKWYPNEDIKNLTRERADILLYKDYWKNYNINKLPNELSDIVFDNAVNQGQITAIQNLHKSLVLVPEILLAIKH